MVSIVDQQPVYTYLKHIVFIVIIKRYDNLQTFLKIFGVRSIKIGLPTGATSLFAGGLNGSGISGRRYNNQ